MGTGLFWNLEKRGDYGVAYKISRTVHYDRNNYNKIGSQQAATLYPTENNSNLIANGWEQASSTGSYFHRFLGNNNNLKYTKDVAYYNLQAQAATMGSLELVYTGTASGIETDTLVTYTFNFATAGTYDEDSLILDGHWVTDVYPYLVWGNTLVDANNHTAYERFAWDKDSGVLGITGLNELEGSLLITKFEREYALGSYTGTAVPAVVVNETAPLFD